MSERRALRERRAVGAPIANVSARRNDVVRPPAVSETAVDAGLARALDFDERRRLDAVAVVIPAVARRLGREGLALAREGVAVDVAAVGPTAPVRGESVAVSVLAARFWRIARTGAGRGDDNHESNDSKVHA